MTPIFLAKVEHNRLKLENPDQFGLWCGQFEGKDVQVIVKKKTRKRTTGQVDELGNQNGYLHGVVFPLCAKELGYTVEEMKEVFIQLFSPYTTKKVGNLAVNVHLRTHEMDTVQCMNFIDSIVMKMSELNIIIPPPEKII